ncbi:hypothetical protein D3C77_405050 [compost metagenome]
MKTKSSYFLKSVTLGWSAELEIDETEYKAITNARRILSVALSIEEKYDLVLGNFMDFEKELLLLTMDKITDRRFDYERAYATHAVINRRLANFVISGKHYTELIAGQAAKCAGNVAEVEATIEALKRKHYDGCLDYRFMEVLRGHLSHSGAGVHSVGNPDKWMRNENGEATSFVFNINVYSLKAQLAENSGFKRPVLRELPEKIDLKKAVRSYLGAISDIQMEVRKLTKNSTSSARDLIKSYIDKYSKANNGKSFAVSAHGLGEEPVMLFLDWDDVRIGLAKKNQSVSNMNRRHVSSAIESL